MPLKKPLLFQSYLLITKINPVAKVKSLEKNRIKA
mgnify:CR=1 FL=1